MAPPMKARQEGPREAGRKDANHGVTEAGWWPEEGRADEEYPPPPQIASL